MTTRRAVLALTFAVAFLWVTVAASVALAFRDRPETLDACTSTAVQWVHAGNDVWCVDR